MMFSAKDQDNDQINHVNCAEANAGGWWYNACFFMKPTAAVPLYLGFFDFVLATLQAIQKIRMTTKMSD